MTITVSRLPLGVLLAALTATRHWHTAAVFVLLFAVTDVADGVVARARGVDTPGRRALDSIIDRLSICGFFVALATTAPLALAALVLLLGNLLLAADAAPGLLRGVVYQAPQWHKLWTGSLGVGGILVLEGVPGGVAVVLLGTLLHTICGVDLRHRRSREVGIGGSRRIHSALHATQLIQL